MSEPAESLKDRRERHSLELFLLIYNKHLGTGFAITRHDDADGKADFEIQNSAGETIQVEHTFAFDQPGDATWQMAGKERKFSGLEGFPPNVDVSGGAPLVLLQDAVAKKSVKRYQGERKLLLIHQQSLIEWDWIIHEAAMREAVKGHPFDAGIWILSRSGEKLQGPL
jgi:hypothetical protein